MAISKWSVWSALKIDNLLYEQRGAQCGEWLREREIKRESERERERERETGRGVVGVGVPGPMFWHAHGSRGGGWG